MSSAFGELGGARGDNGGRAAVELHIRHGHFPERNAGDICRWRCRRAFSSMFPRIYWLVGGWYEVRAREWPCPARAAREIREASGEAYLEAPVVTSGRPSGASWSAASQRLRGESGRLLYDSVVYGVVRYLAILSGILLTPVYTRLLTKEDYGLIEIFVTWNTLVVMVIPLGLPTALQRFYPDVADGAVRKREMIGTIHVMVLVAASVYAILLSTFRGVFLEGFNATSAPLEIFYLSIVVAMLTSCFAILQALHQAAARKYHFAGLSVLNFSAATSLGFVLVYWFHQGVVGFFRASVVALVVTIGVGLSVTKDALTIAFERSAARRLLKYSLPFVWVFLLFQSSNVLDRFLITRFMSLGDAGVFSVANKVAGITSLAVSSFALVWFPYAMRAKTEPDAKELYAGVFSLYVAAAAILVNLICIFRDEIIRVIAPGYAAAYGSIAILCLYYVVAGSVSILTIGLHIAERTKHIALAALASVVTNVVASVLLVQVVGLEGIAYGSLLGGMVWIMLQVRKAQPLYPVPFSYGFGAWAAAVTVAVAYGGAYLDMWLGPAETVVRIATKGLVFMMVVGVIAYGFPRKVRHMLRG